MSDSGDVTTIHTPTLGVWGGSLTHERVAALRHHDPDAAANLLEQTFPARLDLRIALHAESPARVRRLKLAEKIDAMIREREEAELEVSA